MKTIKIFIQLIRPYWFNRLQWFAWVLLFGVIGFSLAIIEISVLINEWNKVFYDALTDFATDKFIPLLLQYLFYIVMIVLFIACGNWLRKLLLLRWRTYLTRQLEAQWLRRHNLYRLSVSCEPDNPDQRIAEDVYLLAEKSIDLIKYFFYNLYKLIAFVGILWTISGVQNITLFGTEIVIKGYLVWVALIYTLICTLLTHFIGHKLKPLNVERQQTEAEYRAALIRVRDNAEQIAFYQGEARERERLISYFSPIIKNWKSLMLREFKLECFSASYLRVTMLIPIFAVLPLYLGKTITFGTMMQARSAFSSVQDGFGWFMDFYKRIMEWAATVQRLWEFQQSLNNLSEQPPIVQTGNVFRCDNLTVKNRQNHTALFRPVSFVLLPGEWLNLQGRSGVGKTSFLRTVAGLWHDYEGSWQFPSGRILFIPQKSYLPKDTLANLLIYPRAVSKSAVENSEILAKVLIQVGLPQLISQLEEEKEWGQILSGGEQQRIAVARVLLFKPDLLCIDEITNQLDFLSARYLLKLLRTELPNMAVIGITHQQELRTLFERHYCLENTFEFLSK